MRWEWPDAATKTDWGWLAAIGAVTVALGLVKNFTFVPVCVTPIWVALILLTIAGYLKGAGRLPRLSSGLATMAWVFSMAPIVSHAVYVLTTAGFPLYDEAYARIDAALGIDNIGLVQATGASAWFSDLSLVVYKQFAWQAMFAYALLVATRQYERLADTITIMTIGFVATLVLSTVFPALGIAAYYGLTGADFGYLGTSGATTWHLPHYLALRAGTMTTFPAPGEWQGLVCFPSFHVIHALAAAYAVSNIRWLALPSAVFSGFMIFTAIPVGGHFFIDLVGGYAIYAASVWYVDWRRAARLARVLPAAPDLYPSAA